MVLKYLIEKEFKQMMRNIILPIVFILLPLGMINVMPRAATQEVKNLNISVVDNDHSSLSERLVHKLSASGFFHLQGVYPSYGRALESVEDGAAMFVVEIEDDFEKHLVVDGVSRVMISANAVNGVKAGLGSSYLVQILADYSAQLREEQGYAGGDVRMSHYDVLPRYLYNTNLDYKVFMIPGLMSMLLILLVGFLPALNIVGEKEKGTIEQINVTPVSRMEFILSKLIPYWVVGLVILIYAMILAWRIFGLVPEGSIALLFLFASLFILVVSGFGLIVSNFSSTTQQAALVMFFFLVIFLLMSGLLTPVAGMPEWAQAITTVNPLRYFIEVMRTIYLKGSTFIDLRIHFIVLTVYALVVGTIAVLTYRKSA